MTITCTHDELWAHTLDQWRDFHQVLVKEAGNPDFWRAMHENKDFPWTLAFTCPIKSTLNQSCGYASEFLQIINKCLDYEKFVEFIISSHLHIGYIRSLLHCLSVIQFAQQVPFRRWNTQSKLAFQVVMKIITPNSRWALKGVGSYYRRLHKLMHIVFRHFGHEFGPQRWLYMLELGRAFGQYEFVSEQEAKLSNRPHDDRRPCECLTNDTSPERIEAIRRVLCEGILHATQRPGGLGLIIRRQLLNYCDLGNISQRHDMDALFGSSLFSRNHSIMRFLSLGMFHNESFIKSWTRNFLTYALHCNCTLLFYVPAHLLARPMLARGMISRDEPEWALFLQRSRWFVETYLELFPLDPAGGLEHLISGPVTNFRQYARQAAARLLAILQLHQVFSQEEHMRLIETAINWENAEYHGHTHSSRKDTIASLLLTLDDECCTNLLIMMPPDAFTTCYFTQAAWNATILRFVKPDASDLLFMSAIEATNLFQKDMLASEARRKSLYPLTSIRSYLNVDKFWYESLVAPYERNDMGRSELRLSFIDRLLVVLDAGKHQDLVLKQLEYVASLYLISRINPKGYFELALNEEIVFEALDRSVMANRKKPFPRSLVHLCPPSGSKRQELLKHLMSSLALPYEAARRFTRRSYLKDVLKLI